MKLLKGVCSCLVLSPRLGKVANRVRTLEYTVALLKCISIYNIFLFTCETYETYGPYDDHRLEEDRNEQGRVPGL